MDDGPRRSRRLHQRVVEDGNKTSKASRHGEGIQGPNIIENQPGSSHYRRESIFEALVEVDPEIVLDEGDESPVEITNGKGPHTHACTKYQQRIIGRKGSGQTSRLWPT